MRNVCVCVVFLISTDDYLLMLYYVFITYNKYKENKNKTILNIAIIL